MPNVEVNTEHGQSEDQDDKESQSSSGSDENPIEGPADTFPYRFKPRTIFSVSVLKLFIGALALIIGIINAPVIQHYSSHVAFPIWCGLVVSIDFFNNQRNALIVEISPTTD